MNNVKKIAALLTVLGVITGFAEARQRASGPDATLRLRMVRGLSVGRVGMTSSSASGDVFSLRHLRDFSGHYNVNPAGTRGVTLGAGRTGTIMSNQAGVIVRISSTQQGVAVNATGGGVDMQLQ